jgi:hypothetical protein
VPAKRSWLIDGFLFIRPHLPAGIALLSRHLPTPILVHLATAILIHLPAAILPALLLPGLLLAGATGIASPHLPALLFAHSLLFQLARLIALLIGLVVSLVHNGSSVPTAVETNVTEPF